MGHSRAALWTSAKQTAGASTPQASTTHRNSQMRTSRNLWTPLNALIPHSLGRYSLPFTPSTRFALSVLLSSGCSNTELDGEYGAASLTSRS